MKKCVQCHCDLQDDAMFCSDCGAAQPEHKPDQSNQTNQQGVSQPTTQQVLAQAGTDTARIAQQLSEHIFSQVSNVLRWEKLAYIGMGMTAISVVLPLISISLISCITSMVSISQMLSFVMLSLCCIAGYYASEEKYNIPLSINVGILVTFSVIYYKLYTVVSDAGEKISELSKLGKGVDPQAAFAMSLLKEYADKIVGLGMGVYFLLAGTLVVIIACSACRLSKKKLPINIGSICNEVKLALMDSAEMAGQKLPGFVVSILVVLLLLFVASSIEIFGFKVSAML